MKKVGRKFLFLILFMLFLHSTGANAKTGVSKDIVFENKENASFSERIISSINDNSQLLLSQDDLSEDSTGGFIKGPKPDEHVYENQQKTLFGSLKQSLKDIYELKVEQTDSPQPLLADKLTFDFENGPIDNIHLWNAYQMNFTNMLPERGHNTSKYNVSVIDVIIDGQFKGKKESFRIMLEPSQHKGHAHFMHKFFQDLYIESARIPHTKLLLGNSRPGVGIEGTISPYTLDFVSRAQIARNFANARKLGFKVRGDYSLMDYDMGIYSSGTNFTDFFPGHEVDAWMNIKPLGKTDGRYGKIITGTGVQSGEKHGVNYFTTGAYTSWEYKKFKSKFEYARANGSNGSTGLTDARAQGFYWTNIYKLTPKIELLTRFDQFDPNRHTKNNNQREYTLGANYYIKGQALKLIFNYVYCQNDSRTDSHRLILGTQIVL